MLLDNNSLCITSRCNLKIINKRSKGANYKNNLEISKMGRNSRRGSFVLQSERKLTPKNMCVHPNRMYRKMCIFLLICAYFGTTCTKATFKWKETNSIETLLSIVNNPKGIISLSYQFINFKNDRRTI